MPDVRLGRGETAVVCGKEEGEEKIEGNSDLQLLSKELDSGD